MTTEVTIYEKNDKMYCSACKPQGGKRGTLMTSAYGHYCAGCGEDLKEIGESQKEMTELIITASGPLKRIVRSKRMYKGILVGAIHDQGYLVMVRFDSAWWPIHTIRKLRRTS